MLKRVNLGVFWLICLGVFLVLLGSVIVAISVGAVGIQFNWIFEILFNKVTFSETFPQTWPNTAENIVWGLRLPKVIVAVCVGAGLSLVGIFMQAITKNALADPYILGISSGASAGAVAVILLGSFVPFIGWFSISSGAFIGSLLSAVIVFLLAGVGRSGSTTKLVLSGTAIAFLFSALTNLLIFISPDPRKVNSAITWMAGSFAGTDWSDVLPVTIALAIGIICVFFLSHTLDIMLLGEDMAITLGVNVRVVKIVVIILSTLLTGALVSVSGVIGFVGLVIPHIARTLVGTAHKRLIPFSMLLGGIFLLWADVIARVVSSPSELPIGVVTALLGVPFFLFLLRRSKYSFSN